MSAYYSRLAKVSAGFARTPKIVARGHNIKPKCDLAPRSMFVILLSMLSRFLSLLTETFIISIICQILSIKIYLHICHNHARIFLIDFF